MLRHFLNHILITAAISLPACLSAQPVVRILEPSAQAATSAATVSVKGVAAADSAIINIYWTDHQGHTGPAEWTPSTAGPSASVAFSAAVPVRPGANRIAVVAVDSRNRSGSAQLSVYSQAPQGPPVSEIRSGWWHGMPVTYAVINGQAIIEGDIILGPAAQLAASAPPGPGTGVIPDGFSIGYVSELWPEVAGVYQIPYTIETAATNLSAALSYVNSTLTGIIQFVPQTNQTNYVTFDFDTSDFSGSCESSVGMLGGQQFVGGSVSCALATLVHEMGHTIGLLHEHQRPDRNTWITFNYANVDEPLVAGNFDFFSYNYQMIGLYDIASVMHYPPFSFTKNGLTVLESIPPGIPLSNSTGYSAGDIDTIKRLYGFTPSAVTIVTNPPGLQIIVDGTTYTAPQTFTWTLNSKHTLNLPPDPQLTNPNDGATYEFGVWNDGGARSHSVTAGGGSGLLTSPAADPATTVYEANFIRLWPFSISPTGGGSVSVTPLPQSIFDGTFFVDRQLITLSATTNAGYNFYGWNGPPYPQGGNPYPLLIQSPEPTLQGIFTTYPVTTIGENITGPNTWDPPLYATVDTNPYTYLPQGYSQDQSGAAWAPGTTHSITAPSPDIPITTNVSYTWNNWSDNGAQTHNITASSSGVENIVASYTPVYVSYTYAENDCGTVAYSQSCPDNYCSFADGTVITMTATPYAGNGMIFSGWTGDLSGTTNPLTTTIHDEFLPVANFNIVPTIINAATVTPASPVKSAAASKLTVTGAGFVNGSFYAYWNNAFRTSTGVTATQATIDLKAGDLSAAGAQLLQVSNFTNTNPSCGAYAYTQVLVKNTQGTPRLKIAKTHTGNFTKGQKGATYTVTVTNPATSTGPTAGKVTVTDTIPSGLTLVSMAGTGWTCAAKTCTRTDVLAVGKAYPVMTVTVNVAANAPSEVTNTVTVSGGDSPAATATNQTTIN
jgi:uncharacterized repeat protein (TIGR01451 family)